MPNVVGERSSTWHACGGVLHGSANLPANYCRICESDIDALFDAFEHNLVHVKVNEQSRTYFHCAAFLCRARSCVGLPNSSKKFFLSSFVNGAGRAARCKSDKIVRHLSTIIPHNGSTKEGHSRRF